MGRISWVLCLCLSLCGQLVADPKDFYYQQFLRKQHPSSVYGPSIPAKNFQQQLSHSDPSDTRTFTQRYWVNNAYAKGADAPVFFMLCGEASCGPGELSGAMDTLARKSDARMVALEHRFYGQSQPFQTLTTDDLKYLTTESALQDAASFVQYAKQTLGYMGKWVVVGGSYAGSLSAFFRSQHPELVVGSWASSAPVQARADFEEYDHHLSDVAGPACGAAMRSVVAQVDQALLEPAESKKIRLKFAASQVTDDDDFRYVVADMGAIAIQYGYRDQFCDLLTHPAHGSTALDNYAGFGINLFKDWGLTAVGDTPQASMSTNAADYEFGIGQRQWLYQSCTEYGYWQVAYHDSSNSVRSPHINMAYHQNLCRRLFGITAPVNDAVINDKLYEPLLSPVVNQIFFSNGSEDPWGLLSITHANGNDGNPNLTLYEIDKSAHCGDLYAPAASDSVSLTGARSELGKLITDWLK